MVRKTSPWKVSPDRSDGVAVLAAITYHPAAFTEQESSPGEPASSAKGVPAPSFPVPARGVGTDGVSARRRNLPGGGPSSAALVGKSAATSSEGVPMIDAASSGRGDKSGDEPMRDADAASSGGGMSYASAWERQKGELDDWITDAQNDTEADLRATIRPEAFSKSGWFARPARGR